MFVAIFGVGLMVYDGTSLGYSLGNISAFMSAGCFAIMLVIARRSRKTDVLGGTFMAGVFSAALGAVAAFLLDGGVRSRQVLQGLCWNWEGRTSSPHSKE